MPDILYEELFLRHEEGKSPKHIGTIEFAERDQDAVLKLLFLILKECTNSKCRHMCASIQVHQN